MPQKEAKNEQQNALKNIPKMDKILSILAEKNANKMVLKNFIKDELDSKREQLKNGETPNLDAQEIAKSVWEKFQNLISQNLKKIINATGIITQTNFGRSILDSVMLSEILPLLSHYNNLEYDIEKGQRGERYAHASHQMIELFCAALPKKERKKYDALLVNNNASAVLLILNTFAKNKEVLISRGELVEIGGSFRMPEVMKSAGAILREVGATNKTHLRDFESAINKKTALLMKAHKSNFYMKGFVREVKFEELIALSKSKKIIDYFDLGSGFLEQNFSKIAQNIKPKIALNDENINALMSLKPSLISFSGDKLFGGVQAGIIIGKKELIKRLKENHLLRALRVDKFSIIATSATLSLYLQNKIEQIPTLNMLSKSQDSLQKTAQFLCEKLRQIPQNICEFHCVKMSSKIGGGSLPNVKISSFGVEVKIKDSKFFSAQKLEALLRKKALICRIKNNKILLDMRTLKENDLEAIVQIFGEVLWKI